MKVQRRFFVFLMTMASGGVMATGIDCVRAASSVEKTICANPTVVVLDKQLSGLFETVLHNTFPVSYGKVVSDQKSWIVDVRNHCMDASCLHDAYMDRLQNLSKIDNDSSYMYDPSEINGTITSIRNSLHRFGVSGDLTGCETLVRVGSGREHSFGGECNVDGHALYVCNDTMVGKLTIHFSISEGMVSQLVDFTKENCPPGG